ncbi:MAG TPA: 3-hydroxyacyl-CoA dehydrogenase NAD-binding domain-containing protein [Stellaceae bacterium]|jgi:3-hydroxyacyl-CoA dehydrogenase|nr:3-hydroxyacyl-CoA dehydrogenase NAD-binding domain-containing protein [Stellaceae bacterium]
MEQREVRRVAVIGTGTIGMSWAATFLSRGLEVYASDPAPDAEPRMRRFIDAAWPVLARLATIAAMPPYHLLKFCADAESAAANADFVQESAPEREPIKQALLARIDAVLPAEVVIASSSSGLLISRLVASCRHPERCVIGHPFNPPHLIPLVEVVAGAQTSPATVAQAMAFYASVGKRPIHIRREVAGHVANRLQAALWREAVHLVASGVASVEDVDAAISEGPGLRWALMGPHLTFHLAGGAGGMAHFLDQLGPPMESWWDDLGAPRLTAELGAALAGGVADEAGGRDIATLEAERDRFLVDLLALKNSTKR